MTTIKEDLREARALLAKGWCRFYSARSAVDTGIDPASPKAIAWSIYGAFRRLYILGGRGVEADNHTLRCLEEVLGKKRGQIPYWIWEEEPDRTQEDVLALFDYAIESAPE